MYDIIIIGGGPAGLSAALYAGRGGMKTLVLEKMSCGGQVLLTPDVDNYLGFNQHPSGMDLGMQMKKHAEMFGAEFSTETVSSIENADGKIKNVVTRKNTYQTKTIIFATGAVPRHLGVSGEMQFAGMGVSYCASCDGAFFKGQTAIVVGGGDTACEDALYLANFCSQVYLIHRRDSFRATKILVDQIQQNEKITLVTDSIITQINGDTAVKSATVLNVKNNIQTTLDTSAVFVAVGTLPQVDLAKEVVALNQDGFIKTDNTMATNIAGIFAAGDVRDTVLRQIITAAADGAIAATSAIHYASSIHI